MQHISLKNHSESRWSTIAQISLIKFARDENIPLHIYKSNRKSNKEVWLKKEDKTFEYNNYTSNNLIVEGNISKKVFFTSEKTNWDNDFSNIKPDLLWINEKEKKVKIIEIKTIGASVTNNLKLYRRFNDFLNKNGWKSDLYYLLSYGHEKTSDWDKLEEDNANIILWEEIFLAISNTEIEYLVGSNLKDYTELPAWI